MSEPALKYGLGFTELYERDGLTTLDREFVAHLAAGDVALHDRLMAARVDVDAVERKTESELIVDLAPHVGASLDVMERESKRMRGARPFVFTNLRVGQGIDAIASFIERAGGLGSA